MVKHIIPSATTKIQKEVKEVNLLEKSSHADSDVEAVCRQNFISKPEKTTTQSEGTTRVFLYKSKYTTICTIIQLMTRECAAGKGNVRFQRLLSGPANATMLS